MSNLNDGKFSSDVIEKIQYYVYRLIDPRSGETFYIGKGKGNRVFSHARGDVDADELSNKMARIRDIKLAGFEVAHVIHRHGLSEKVAFEVEGALIDAYPGITNIADGHGNNEFGVMHTTEVIKKYSSEIATFNHKAILISVNRSALESSLYEAVRYAWRLNKTKASDADIILATVQGLIVGVFVAEEWLDATEQNFPGREPVKERFGFIGQVASKVLEDLYIGKRIPDSYRKKGASNPIKYTWH